MRSGDDSTGFREACVQILSREEKKAKREVKRGQSRINESHPLFRLASRYLEEFEEEKW